MSKGQQLARHRPAPVQKRRPPTRLRQHAFETWPAFSRYSGFFERIYSVPRSAYEPEPPTVTLSPRKRGRRGVTERLL